MNMKPKYSDVEFFACACVMNGKETYTYKTAKTWAGNGLVYHKSLESPPLYTISHGRSGRVILRRLKKTQIDEQMIALREFVNWNESTNVLREDKKLKELVRILQRKVDNENDDKVAKSVGIFEK